MVISSEVRICGLPYGTNTCASCVNTSCCAESTACSSDPLCSPFATCLGGCKGDPACRSQCLLDTHPGPGSSFPALGACLASSCETECGLTCGGLALVTQPDAATSCQSCLVPSGACGIERACATSVACQAVYEECAFACATFDCAQDCIIAQGEFTATGQNTDGGTWLPFVQDLEGDCAEACASGRYWPCLGHTSWPQVQPQEVDVTLVATDSVSSAPLEAVDVYVCNGDDPDCTMPGPLAHGETDETGTVELRFRDDPTPLDLGLQGFLQMSSPSVVPALLYWGFPLSEATVPLRWTLFSGSGIASITAPFDVTQDPGLGVILAYVGDCIFDRAPGVKVALDVTADGGEPVREFYGMTDPTATETDPTGLVFFFNVPATHSAEVTATPAGYSEPSSKVSVQVRAGSITGVLMYPTP